MKRNQAGFTLIELVIVIVILGILAATALPRFVDVTDEAHKAAVAGAGGGLGAGVQLAHAQWYAQGKSPLSVDMDGVTVSVNNSGWPIGDGSDQTCVAVWESVMNNPPSVSTGDGSDYKVSGNDITAGDTCTYNYVGDSGTTRSIAYDTSDGSVEVSNP